MKNLAKALVLTVTMGASLMASDALAFYAGGGLAVEAVPDINGLSMGTGLVLRGGMKFDQVLEGFGAEVELSKSIIHPEYSYTRDNSKKVNVLTLATYAVYRIKVMDNFYVKPRFGIILPNLGDSNKDLWKDSDDGGWVNSRNITFSSGIGAGYTVMEHLDVYIDYTVLGENVTNYGAGVEWHF